MIVYLTFLTTIKKNTLKKKKEKKIHDIYNLRELIYSGSQFQRTQAVVT
jgi:hypothetical protein